MDCRIREVKREEQLLDRRPRNLIILSIILCCVFLWAAPPASWADIYKYIDDEGVVHFTNVPTNSRFKLILREKRVQFQLGTDFDKYDSLILKAAEKHSVNYALVKAVIKAESNFDHRAVSRVGARGLMQLMPDTAYALHVSDSFHPDQNIDGGVRYLRYLLNAYDNDLYLALAAYNAGEKAVLRYRGIPPYQETRTYIHRVLRYYQEYSKEQRSPEPAITSNN